jgi:hypothetical protein
MTHQVGAGSNHLCRQIWKHHPSALPGRTERHALERWVPTAARLEARHPKHDGRHFRAAIGGGEHRAGRRTGEVANDREPAGLRALEDLLLVAGGSKRWRSTSSCWSALFTSVISHQSTQPGGLRANDFR